MKVRFHTPHIDGEGCATPKPPELTAAIAALDGKVMGVLEGAARLKASVRGFGGEEIHRGWIGVRIGHEIIPGVRQFEYRAIYFDEVGESSVTLERRMAFDRLGCTFAVAGPLGGVHYRGSWSRASDIPPRIETGCVEIHYRTKPHKYAYARSDCWLIGGTCYYDGSSMYVEEVYTPLFHRCNDSRDFEPLWRKLESEYRARFEKEGDE